MIASGSPVAIDGATQISTTATNISTTKGSTPQMISPRLMSGAMFLMTNRFSPTGGWMRPVSMTIVMEAGLIHPPVGLNIFVIKNIAPDIPLGAIIWGVLPFVVLMFVAVVIICVMPQIATALPDAAMGAVPGR